MSRDKQIDIDLAVEEMASALRERTVACNKCEYYKEGSCLKCVVSTARNQAKADTVRKMQEALEHRIHSKLSYHGWYIKETVIAEIAKEMLESASSGSDTCIRCGEIIPEGRQVCPKCEEGVITDKKSQE